MSDDVKSTLIEKQASRFKVGETIYLRHCDTGSLYGVLKGPFRIREIKHQSDTGVTFSLSPYFGHDGKGVRYDLRRNYMVEFGRTARLTRLRGEPITCIIQEEP